MDPYDVLIPENRVVAAEDPKTIPEARCECGVYGCGSTDVRITRTSQRGSVGLGDRSSHGPSRGLVADQAEQRLLWDLTASLEPLIDEVFSAGYREVLERCPSALRDPVD